MRSKNVRGASFRSPVSCELAGLHYSENDRRVRIQTRQLPHQRVDTQRAGLPHFEDETQQTFSVGSFKGSDHIGKGDGILSLLSLLHQVPPGFKSGGYDIPERIRHMSLIGHGADLRKRRR